jgi:hypothetical protein
MIDVPKDIDAALGGLVMMKDGQGQARLLSYTDQPTVTIEFPDGHRQSIVERVFREKWTVPKPLTEGNKARAAGALQRAGLHAKIGDADLQNLIVETMARELDDQADELF